MIVSAAATLRASGSPTPRLDAEVLLAHVTGRERSWLLAHGEAPLTAAEGAAFTVAVQRRAAGEPVAYIRGFKEWLSLRIRTDGRALVPRPETEVLAEAAMAEVASRLERGPVTAWEVATGSGAVALALALRFREALESGALKLIASDISVDALALAAENLDDHDVRGLVSLEEADLLDPAGVRLPLPDVVIANLPYLSSDEVDAAAGWLGHEPRVALEAGPDGLALLRALFEQLPARAAAGATVLLEVADAQADAVVALAPRSATPQQLHDLAGVPRVVIARLPS